MRIIKFFKKIKVKKLNFNNSVSLYLSGYNLERCLNNICDKNIKIFSAEKFNPKNSKIEVDISKENEVEKFLKEKGIEVIKKKYNGFAKFQKFFSSRYGILIGIFFAFCFYVVASNYVLNIKILGNESRSSQDIIAVLNENGVNIFNPLNLKTNENIEQIILDNFSEVSMVSVIKKGNTILINIKERLVNDEYEQVGKHTSLIATNDGIITDIQLIQGTLLVKIGDIVRTGDYLVAPYVIDSSGNKISIEPKANIYADVWLSGESEHYDVKKITEKTGNQITERAVVFLNQIVYTNKIELSFKEYEMEITERYLSKSIIPIKYKTIKYYETTTYFFEQPFSEVELSKIQEAKDLTFLRLDKDEDVKSESYIISSENGITKVSYSITVSRKIS